MKPIKLIPAMFIILASPAQSGEQSDALQSSFAGLASKAGLFSTIRKPDLQEKDGLVNEVYKSRGVFALTKEQEEAVAKPDYRFKHEDWQNLLKRMGSEQGFLLSDAGQKIVRAYRSGKLNEIEKLLAFRILKSEYESERKAGKNPGD